MSTCFWTKEGAISVGFDPLATCKKSDSWNTICPPFIALQQFLLQDFFDVF